MKKLIALALTAILALTLMAAAFADTVTIAVPNDPTNEGRALLLLQSAGVLTLKEGVGLEATKGDIASTKDGLEIELTEVEAALVPEIRQDVDYAIINNNFALQAGLQPAEDSLLIEDADSPYVNVVSVKEGNENTDAAKALAAALKSQKVVDFINNTYGGAAVATVTDITDGYDATVDYDALKGTTISIAATPVPHVEVLAVAAEILGEIQNFYIIVPHWDTVLHTLNGFNCAAIGFALVDLLNRSEQFTFKLSPLFLALTAFCFSMTVGVCWEFVEYTADHISTADMQKDVVIDHFSSVTLDETRQNNPVVVSDISDVIVVHKDGSQEALGVGGYLDVGLNDTMKDLFVNLIGAVVFSIIGFFYVRSRGQGKFAARFIPRIKRE